MSVKSYGTTRASQYHKLYDDGKTHTDDSCTPFLSVLRLRIFPLRPSDSAPSSSSALALLQMLVTGFSSASSWLSGVGARGRVFIYILVS